MMNKGNVLSYILILLIVLSILLPIVSWILSAMGLDCKSLLSEEGWRWLFYNVPVCFANKWTILCLSAIIGLGSVIRCGIFNAKRDINAVYVVLVVSSLIIFALLFIALHPHSPLLSVTGEIKNSPYVYGLPTILIWCIIFLSALYAFLSQRIKTLRDFSDLFTYGVSRFSSVIVIVMFLSFIASCFTYIFNITI